MFFAAIKVSAFFFSATGSVASLNIAPNGLLAMAVFNFDPTLVVWQIKVASRIPPASRPYHGLHVAETTSQRIASEMGQAHRTTAANGRH